MDETEMRKPVDIAQKISPERRIEVQRWDACSIEEKIERLRRTLSDMRWGIDDVRRRTQHFENHQHDALGQIVVPLNPRFQTGEASSRDLLA